MKALDYNAPSWMFLVTYPPVYIAPQKIAGQGGQDEINSAFVTKEKRLI